MSLLKSFSSGKPSLFEGFTHSVDMELFWSDIPKNIIEKLNLKKGDVLSVELDSNGVVHYSKTYSKELH